MDAATNNEKKSDHILNLPRNVFWLGIASFFTDVSSEMIYPLIPIFLTSVLGAPVAIVGLIEGIAESTASILKIFSGWFSDRIGKRKLLAVSGYSLSALSKPLIAFATAPWHVLGARFLDRVGKGIRTSPRDALIADTTDPSEYGKAFGFHRSMDTFGSALGPLLAVALLPLLSNSYRSLFSLAIIPAIIGVLVLAMFVKERSHKEKPKPVRLSLAPFDRTFKIFLVIIFIFTLGNSSDAFLILRAQDAGVSAALIPLVFFVFNIVYALTSGPVGALSDKIGRKRVIIAGYTMFALVYTGFALAPKSAYIWILFALYGFYYAFTEGVFRAFTADLVPAHLRGTAFGLLNLALGVALLPASIFAGLLWDSVSPRAPFWFGSMMAIVALILFIMFIPGKQAIPGKQTLE